MISVVIASGQSLNDEDISFVKKAKDEGRVSSVIAVSNVGIDKAPWADALVSHDSKWWISHRAACDFKGDKYCRHSILKFKTYIPKPSGGCNSGYMAMQVARDIYKATKIVLLGFDMHGTHYFGQHKNGLKNTSEDRFKIHLMQFDGWEGPEVINCTVGSALQKFEFKNLRDVI